MHQILLPSSKRPCNKRLVEERFMKNPVYLWQKGAARLFLVAAWVPLSAFATSYSVDWDGATSGSGSSSGGAYSVWDTMGQAQTADASGGTFAVSSGSLSRPGLAGLQVQVAARRVFYNQSYWDGNSASAGTADDAAIATDKSALRLGGQASFANYTSFSRGITGVMVDIVGLPETVTASDFEFKVGNTDTPSAWLAAAAPSGVSVRSGSGVNGSDRVTVTWASAAVRNTWLEVVVKATAQTGLGADDVFFFGNVVGETGNSATDTKVNSTDLARVRLNLGNVPVTSVHDINRDGKVNSTDLSTIRLNLTPLGGALRLLDLRNVSSGQEEAGR
jgi:hypothetical protein